MANLTTKIQEYFEIQTELKKLKAKENKLRLSLVGTVFPKDVLEGTETRFKGKYQLKASFKLSYKVSKSDYATVEDLMTDAEKDCINWKPEVSLTRYRLLDENERATLDECITVKEAMPSLDVMEIE